VHFYTADGWKCKIYLKALEMQSKGILDVGTLIKEAFRDEELKVKTKEVPAFTRIIVEDVKRTSDETLNMRKEMGVINETKLLQDATSYFQTEFGCEVQISGESDPWIEDPAKRAGRSKPYRPAIYVA
jgi:hypothetical protein